MTGIEPRRITLGNDVKIGKTNNTPKQEKTIDLTLLSKEEDLASINKFISDIEESSDKSVDIKNWNIKVSDQYIDLSSNPKEAIKIMKDLKNSIEKGAKFKGDIKLNGQNPQEIFFKEVKITSFTNQKFGEHDTDGYTLNPLDNTFLNIFTDDSDRVNDIVIGAPLNVFSSVTDAETYAKGRKGTEIILKNKDNLYVVYDVGRKENSKEYKSSDNSAITADNFTENHSRFNKDFLKNVQASKGFLITDDKKTLEISGQTGVEVDQADYSVVKADMQLRMVDINGIQNTKGLYDWQGTLNGVVSIDIKAKMEEVLNKLDLPKGTRVNVDYDEKDKSFVVKLNYELVSERFGELTALKIKPNENGSLSISSFGVLNANLNLTDGISVDAGVKVPFIASVNANGSVSMKETDKVSVKTEANVTLPLTPFNPVGFNFGAKFNPDMKKGEDNKYQVNPNLGNTKNVFIPIETKGILIPDFVEEKTEQWENSAHKTIAGSIIGVAESMEKAGFILPKELKDVKSRIPNWGTNDVQDKKDKQIINDFVNGKIKLEYDLSKQMNLKGFPNASINEFDPNIKFDTDGKKLNIVFDNSKLIASSDGLAKEKAVAETPDGLSINASVRLNNTTASVKTDAHLEVNVSEKEQKDFSNKMTEMGFNKSSAQISGNLSIDAKLNSELENTNDLSKINGQATIDVKANDVNIYVPNTDTKINLKKASGEGNLDVVQDGKNTYLKADAKVSLTGFKVSKGNENLVSLSSADFKGTLSYKSVQTVNENKEKSTKTQVIVQGRLDVNKGKYDNFTAEKLAVDGLVAYTEREGVSFSGATTEAAVKISGHIKNPEQKTDLHIKNIFGYGKVDVDQNGSIKNAEIKAGGGRSGEFKVSGKINDNNFIIDSDLKFKGSIKLNQQDEKMNLSLNGNINHFKMGDIDLKDIDNVNANLVYDSKNNTVTITSKTGKDLDIKGKINDNEFAFKGDASVTFQFDKTSGKLSLIPSAKVELLKVGSFELKEAELNGTKLSITTTEKNNKINLESIDGKNIEFKGKFINGKKETPVDIKGQGNIEINTEKINSKNVYTLTSNTTFEKFQIGDTLFKDAALEGKISYDGENIGLSSADNNSYLKLKATQVNVHTNKENNLDFEAKGNLTLIPDNKDNKSGFSLACKDVELKKGVINNYLIEDAKLNGKIIYSKEEEEKSLTFKGIDDKNPDLNLSGKLTKTYQENGEDKKYVAQISDLGISGGVVFENNKLKFTDIKTDVKGSINGVSINNILVTNTNDDGSTDITLTGDTDGLTFGGSIKFKQNEKGNVTITSTAENGSLKMGFGSKDDIIKTLDDLVKINSINSSAQLVRDIDNIKQQLAAFSSLNMTADLQKFNIEYDPKAKNLTLTSDLEGKMGSKILIDNKSTNFDLKSVDIQGKLTANTESKVLTIDDGVMKGTTTNIEEMVLQALSNAGAIPKDYTIDDKNKVTFKQGKHSVNIDLDKTGVGDDSRITMKTGAKVAGINLNFKMATKITIENIAPKGEPPKNVLKIHIDKSRAAGVISNIDLNGKGKLFGFIPVNLNKAVYGNKTPYLDYVETLDQSKENNTKTYEELKIKSISDFSKTLPTNVSEKEKERKINKHLKENNLQSFEEYQKHNGIVQLEDNKTILFDLSEYLKLKTGGQVNFEIQPSQNVLSGDENEDHFQLGFTVTVNDLGNPASGLPKDDKTAKNLGDVLDQIPNILEQTTNVFDQTNKISTDINKTTTKTIDQTKSQVDNTLNQMKGLNNQVKGTVNQVKPK
jgi:hypothetical protein